jgi:Flp pilus assembly protein TadB
VVAVTGGEERPEDAGPEYERPEDERPEDDAVLVRRARLARTASMGQLAGYSAFGVAVVAFVVGALFGLTTAVVVVVTAALVVGSLLLAPAIILGYAVRAAARDDREHGR